MSRISFEEYGMKLAYCAALRSEDKFRQVGSVALTKDYRVIGTGYNGTLRGFIAPEGFWDDRDERRRYMIHSEINLVSCFKRGEAEHVFCTLFPCNSCLLALLAHGVKNIYYGGDYPNSDSLDIAKMYNINLQKLHFNN